MAKLCFFFFCPCTKLRMTMVAEPSDILLYWTARDNPVSIPDRWVLAGKPRSSLELNLRRIKYLR